MLIQLQKMLKLNMKRKNEEITPKEFDRQVVRGMVSKNRKAKIVSQVVVDGNNIKYAEVVEPLVQKPAEEMQANDYKFSKIELGKQSWLGCQLDA